MLSAGSVASHWAKALLRLKTRDYLFPVRFVNNVSFNVIGFACFDHIFVPLVYKLSSALFPSCHCFTKVVGLGDFYPSPKDLIVHLFVNGIWKKSDWGLVYSIIIFFLMNILSLVWQKSLDMSDIYKIYYFTLSRPTVKAINLLKLSVNCVFSYVYIFKRCFHFWKFIQPSLFLKDIDFGGNSYFIAQIWKYY